jgi:hypothetical protein
MHIYTHTIDIASPETAAAWPSTVHHPHSFKALAVFGLLLRSFLRFFAGGIISLWEQEKIRLGPALNGVYKPIFCIPDSKSLWPGPPNSNCIQKPFHVAFLEMWRSMNDFTLPRVSPQTVKPRRVEIKSCVHRRSCVSGSAYAGGCTNKKQSRFGFLAMSKTFAMDIY